MEFVVLLFTMFLWGEAAFWEGSALLISKDVSLFEIAYWDVSMDTGILNIVLLKWM